MLRKELVNTVSFLLGLTLIFILATYVFSAEGMKTITFKDGTSIQVPEMAPSWMDEDWNHQIKSIEQFSSGKAALVVHSNKDQTVFVISIDIIPSQVEWTTVGYAVVYKDRPNEVELYEDDAYIGTGKASGVFVRLPKGTARTGLEYIRWISGQQI